MQNKFKNAVSWALDQAEEIDGEVVKVKCDLTLLVDYVRQYFNDNNIEYSRFDFNDVKPYIPKDLLN